MKKILKYKRKIKFYDLSRWTLLLLSHIFFWFTFVALVYLFAYFDNKGNVIDIFNGNRAISIFTVAIAPIISWVLHLSYAETGSVAIKSVLWVQTVIIALITLLLITFF